MRNGESSLQKWSTRFSGNSIPNLVEVGNTTGCSRRRDTTLAEAVVLLYTPAPLRSISAAGSALINVLAQRKTALMSRMRALAQAVCNGFIAECVGGIKDRPIMDHEDPEEEDDEKKELSI